MSMYIPVRKKDGGFACIILDAEDAAMGVCEWGLDRYGYARRWYREYGQVYLHREVLGLKKGDGHIGDHINRNRLDNRRSNLRVTNKAGNYANRGVNKNNASGYPGVHWVSKSRKWRARVRQGGREWFGWFSDVAKAGAAAEAKRREWGFAPILGS